MSKTPRAVQTPGASTAAPAAGGTPPADAFQANASATGDSGSPTADPSMDELRSMIAAQAAQINALTAAVQNVSRAQAPARPIAEELPDIDSLDKSKITSPVLTKQGWYVPEKYGTNPAAPKL